MQIFKNVLDFNGSGNQLSSESVAEKLISTIQTATHCCEKGQFITEREET